MIVVEQVVRPALHHGVVDDGTGYLDPGVDLVIEGGQLIKIDVNGHIAGVAVGIYGDIRQQAGGQPAAQPVIQRLTPDVLHDKQNTQAAQYHCHNGHAAQQEL